MLNPRPLPEDEYGEAVEADSARVMAGYGLEEGRTLLPGEAPPPGPTPDGLTRPGVPNQDQNVVATQLDRFYRGREGMQNWAKEAKTSTEFVEGLQWSEEDKQAMEDAGRPVVTLNKINPLVRFLAGHFRMNRYEVRYLPGNDGIGARPVAEALSQIAKHVDETNDAKWHDAEVFQDGIVTGRGFYDYRMDFSQNEMGEIRETVQDPFSIIIDPESDQYDPNDGWGWVQNLKWMSPLDIEAMFGQEGAALIREGGVFGSSPVSADVDDDMVTPDRYFGEDEEFRRGLGYEGMGAYHISADPHDFINVRRNLVRVVECQHRMFKRGRWFVDLENGDMREVPQHFRREDIARILQWAQQNNQPLDVKEQTVKKWRWTVTAGDRLLFDDWSPYRSCSIVPFFAYFRRGKTRGMVADMIDPQREINKRRSTLLHIVTTMANSGWVYEESSIRPEVKEQLINHGSQPGINIEYRVGKTPPQRIEPGAPPIAYERAEQAATMDLKEISGINDSALGQIDKVQSGRAVMARQKQAIISAESYFDNFSRTRQIKGEKILELVQDYYTDARMIRTIGDSGDPIKTFINVALPTGEILNDVTKGKYKVVVDEAPMSATFQNAQFEAAMELAQAGIPIPPEDMVDMAPIPRKDEIKLRMAERARAQAAGMMPPDQPPPQGGRPPANENDGPV